MDLFLVKQHSQTANLASGLLELTPFPCLSRSLEHSVMEPVCVGLRSPNFFLSICGSSVACAQSVEQWCVAMLLRHKASLAQSLNVGATDCFSRQNLDGTR